jgi:hypothetical protein
VYLGRRCSGSVRILRTDLRWFPSLVLLRPLLLFVLVSLRALFWALRCLCFTTRLCIVS